MRKFVDDNWMRVELDMCFAKLNPAIITALEEKIPDEVSNYKNVVMPVNNINVIPNLAPMLASVINQVCEQVQAQVLAHAKLSSKTGGLRSHPNDQHLSIDLNVIAHLPKKGDTVRRATAFDENGNVTEMTETEI